MNRKPGVLTAREDRTRAAILDTASRLGLSPRDWIPFPETGIPAGCPHLGGLLRKGHAEIMTGKPWQIRLKPLRGPEAMKGP